MTVPWDFGVAEGGGDAVGEAGGQAVDLLVDAGLAQLGEGGDAGADGQGVPGEGSGLVHVAQGGHALHYLAASAVAAHGQAAADNLAQGGDVGHDAVQPLRPARAHAEAGNHLVENQHRAVVGGHAAQALEEAGRGRHHAHVARHRLDDDAGYPASEVG